jgi:hypothetical protein
MCYTYTTCEPIVSRSHASCRSASASIPVPTAALLKPVVTAVELQATTEPHCSRGVQPGGICVYVGTARADSRRSGIGLVPRPQALPMLPAAALILYILSPPILPPNPLASRSVDRCSMTRDASAPTAAGGCPSHRSHDYAGSANALQRRQSWFCVTHVLPGRRSWRLREMTPAKLSEQR